MSWRSGNTEVWVMNADGTDQRRITETECGDSIDPRWSPDGQRIAYVHVPNGMRPGPKLIYVRGPAAPIQDDSVAASATIGSGRLCAIAPLWQDFWLHPPARSVHYYERSVGESRSPGRCLRFRRLLSVCALSSGICFERDV
jgi:hypothetical protein